MARLPWRCGNQTSSTSAWLSAWTPALPSTVASAAGPHWYFSCGKNGTPSTCRAAGMLLSSGARLWQAPSSSASGKKRAARRLLFRSAFMRATSDGGEDVGDTQQIENDQQ